MRSTACRGRPEEEAGPLFDFELTRRAPRGSLVVRPVDPEKGTVRVEDGGRLEWCGAGQGGGSGAVTLPGLNSTIVFRWSRVFVGRSWIPG